MTRVHVDEDVGDAVRYPANRVYAAEQRSEYVARVDILGEGRDASFRSSCGLRLCATHDLAVGRFGAQSVGAVCAVCADQYRENFGVMP